MRSALLAAVLLLPAIPAGASAAPGLVPLGAFADPVHVAGPAGDAARVFVVEKAGRVQVVVDGRPAATPFLDLTASVDATGERGLLSIAFAPDYATSGYFYVFYTALDGDLTVLEGHRSAANPNAADDHRRTLFTIEHSSATNHNGGQLAFGPDGMLYVSTGDGATDPSAAQDPASRLGKILRIDPRGAAGPDVWALGLRNPWRFSFDRVTADLLIGDVGAGLHEEIDFASAGAGAGRNYGWPACEGAEPAPCPVAGAIAPAFSLPRSGYTTLIGGFVARDPGLPTLAGRYLFGDASQPTVMSAVVDAAGGGDLRAEPTLPVSFPNSFGEDGCGHVYVAQNAGAVARIQDGPLGPCVLPFAARGCRVAVRYKRTQRILRRGRPLRLTLRAGEACRATLRAGRFHTRRVTLKAGVRRLVRLAPTRRGLRRMRRAVASGERRRLAVSVRIAARDAAGNLRVRRVRARVG